MVKAQNIIIICLALALTTPCLSQTWNSDAELNALESHYVKSLNEFMRRFNAEEIPSFIKQDSGEVVRQRCIRALFDLEQVGDTLDEIAQRMLRFDSAVCANNTLLHIADTGMFAEARCLFKYKKNKIELNLVLVYENIRDNYYRWTIVGANGLVEAGLIDTTLCGYINPVQHELRFSELSGAFPHMNGYFSKQSHVDPLSFVAGLAESGTLQLVGCQSVTYWFTQVPGYVFTVSLHPRKEAYSGWLIHDLMEVSEDDKTMITNYLTGK